MAVSGQRKCSQSSVFAPELSRGEMLGFIRPLRAEGSGLANRNGWARGQQYGQTPFGWESICRSLDTRALIVAQFRWLD